MKMRFQLILFWSVVSVSGILLFLTQMPTFIQTKVSPTQYISITIYEHSLPVTPVLVQMPTLLLQNSNQFQAQF